MNSACGKLDHLGDKLLPQNSGIIYSIPNPKLDTTQTHPMMVV